MEIGSPAGMAMRYVMKQNDGNTSDFRGAAKQNAPSPAGTDDLTEPKIPPEPLEQGGTGGISAAIQLQF